MDITVLDKKYNVLGIVDTVESMIWTDRYQDVGDFELYTPMRAELLSLLKEDHYLKIKDSEHSMIVETTQIKTDMEQGNKLIVRGRSLESLLDRRVVICHSRYDTDVGSILEDLIDRAFVNPEHTNGFQDGTNPLFRRIPNMQWSGNPDPDIPTTFLKYQFFGHSLLDIFRTLATETNVGFYIKFTDTNQFRVGIYMGKDRSYQQSTNPYVIFSPAFDNLLHSDYFRSKANYKNWSLVYSHLYDTGAIHIRTNGVTGHDDPTGINHRETYSDQTSVPRYIQGTSELIDTTQYNGQIDNIGRKILIEDHPIVEQFDGLAQTNVQFTYGVDFFLGDIVQIENEYGMQSRARVTEITFAENPSGYFVYPTFKKV